MEQSRNGSQTDNTVFAIEILQRINGHLNGNGTNGGTGWKRYADSTERDDISAERAVDQHLASSVVFTRIETENGYTWKLENVWDNVSIRSLNDIGEKARDEWYPVEYSAPRNICVAMAENVNVVLSRTITDWSRLDGSVWSQQIVWSGSFADCHRVLQLLEDNSNSIQLRGDRFDLHTHLRKHYIARHDSYPTAAAMAAVESFPRVIIPVESMGTGDGEGDICTICQDMLSTDIASRLPCNHIFIRSAFSGGFILNSNALYAGVLSELDSLNVFLFLIFLRFLGIHSFHI